MLSIDKLHCTGCGACVQKCPKACISFVKDELGAIMPQIDTATCIDCGLCNKVCPIEQQAPKHENQAVFAAVNTDKSVLQNSTSGGFFTALAEYVLTQNGVVYGCAFEDDFKARHIRIEAVTDIEKLRGSKYVQSDTGDTFKQAENDLKQGRSVLYTGTPCQIAGLKSFLMRDYPNLITVDIVCHGVGSQAFFDKYMDFMKRRHGIVKELHFRNKEFAGWSCGGVVVVVSSNGQKGAKRLPYYDYNNYYYYYFLQGDIYRESCYTCKYANTNRPGDFTMGDFWGVESYKLDLDTLGGCSLVIASTEKAKQLMPLLAEKLETAEVTMEQATKANGQLVHPSNVSAAREKLIADFETMDGAQMNAKFRSQNRRKTLKLHLKALVPFKVKRILRKMRR